MHQNSFALIAIAIMLVFIVLGAAIAQSPLEQPGISVPWCDSSGISIYWHTQNRGEKEAPDGWRVERRNLAESGWVVRSWDFIGTAADNLQTFNDRFWDWTDRSAEPNVAYTYRVKALESGSELPCCREWSRRAPVTCS